VPPANLCTPGKKLQKDEVSFTACNGTCSFDGFPITITEIGNFIISAERGDADEDIKKYAKLSSNSSNLLVL